MLDKLLLVTISFLFALVGFIVHLLIKEDFRYE